MFLRFFYALRARGIPVTPTEWLTLMEALARGLAYSDLVRFYHLARAICVKSETLYDAYDQTWLEVFEGIEAPAQLRDEVYEWLRNPILPRELSAEELAAVEAMSLEDLRREFEQRLAEQKERHDGGSRWIGTGGTSPFGHGGFHPGGLRVGGPGGGGMAAQIAGRRAFANYRSDQVLDTRQIGVALKKLRRFAREGATLEVDIDATIDATAREGGEITVVERPERISDLKVLLLMDAGGSMTPHNRLVSQLFTAGKETKTFKTFDHFYFHNCVYQSLYRDYENYDRLPTAQVLRDLTPEHRLIFVGDASMASWELFSAGYAFADEQRSGLEWLQAFSHKCAAAVWLNPDPERFWNHPTVRAIGDQFRMYPLTLDGLRKAVQFLRVPR